MFLAILIMFRINFMNFRLSDNASAEAIMSSVRDTIASYKFLFNRPEQQARIIEGSEEGAFSWVTTNYLSGTFGVSLFAFNANFHLQIKV